ncbi:MazG-like family protein [Streptomyces atriruber]|uniref:MazG-like family protein n=1 Tax=Streptomyces atriruber TaxID=545121 RepID=UPI0006E26C0F|nr:MazG-like family protein [Streptomyces atriruber]
MTGPWTHVDAVVDWLDNAAKGQGDQTALRLLKIGEEYGEATQAYIGAVGQNPRKGFTHAPRDVAEELCDVILAAMVALHGFTVTHPQDFFEAYVDTRAQRLAALTDRTQT